MTESNIDEIKSALGAAKNLNAALKNCLKKEGSADASLARFLKDFRAVVSIARDGSLNSFIERSVAGRESYFLLVTCYAHAEFIGKLVEQVITIYGDRFNATYEKAEQGITIKDKATFSSIVKEVSKVVDAALKDAALPTSNYMKSAVHGTIFEKDVLEEVRKILKS